MRTLVIGGSGRVASSVIPHLKKLQNICVFDLRPPTDSSLDYIAGSVTDHAAMQAAMKGMDAVLYMAMGSDVNWNIEPGMSAAFDVNSKGVYLALNAAHLAGVQHAVYTSSMSVYDGHLVTRYFYDEDIPVDGRNIYALTKYMGEMVCRNAWTEYKMTVNALRLCFPVTNERWQEVWRKGEFSFHTSGSDLARALDAALRYRNGYQVFTISGEWEQKIFNMAKAKRLLNWEPLTRPLS